MAGKGMEAKNREDPLVSPSPISYSSISIRSVQEKVREKLGLCKDTVIILATNNDRSYIEKIAESQL